MGILSDIETGLAQAQRHADAREFGHRAAVYQALYTEKLNGGTALAIRQPDGLAKESNVNVDYEGREDVLRPNPDALRGFVEGYYVPGLPGYMRQHERKLWNTVDADPDVSGGIAKVARKGMMLPWSIKEVEPGKGNPAHVQLLHDFFRYPNLRDNMTQILWVTYFRLKALGRCYWRILRRKVDGGAVETISTAMGGVLEGVFKSSGFVKELEAKVRRELESMIDDDTPVGFEWLQGQIDPLLDQFGRFRNDKMAYVQTVGFGLKTQYFPKRDIVEFRRPHPGGGIQDWSEVRLIERYSDASLWAFVQNRDILRGVAAAKKVLLLAGISPEDRDRFELDLMRRCDPASIDEYAVPMVLRANRKDDMGMQVEDFGVDNQDAKFPEWEDQMQYKKGEVINVNSAMLGKTARLNRANMDAIALDLAEEVNSIRVMVEESINKGIVVDSFGFMDVEWRQDEMDSRPIKERHSELRDDLHDGAVTMGQYVEQMHGVEVAASLPEELADMRLVYQQTVVPLETAIENANNPPMPQPQGIPSSGESVAPEGGKNLIAGNQAAAAKDAVSSAGGMPEKAQARDAAKAVDAKLKKSINDRDMPLGAILKSLQRWEDASANAARTGKPFELTVNDVPREIQDVVFAALGDKPDVMKIHEVFRLAKQKAREAVDSPSYERSNDPIVQRVKPKEPDVRMTKEVPVEALLDESRRDSFIDGMLALVEDRFDAR